MPSISITIKEKNAERLDALADAMDRSRSWVANQAIEAYIAQQEWMDSETAAAVAEVDAGADMVPHDQVIARMEERRKARRS